MDDPLALQTAPAMATLPLPPAPAALQPGQRAQSTGYSGPPGPSPPNLRRMRSEPPGGVDVAGGRRFTDRLLLLLTRETTESQASQVPPAVVIGFGEDPPCRSSASRAPGRCSICFEDKDATVQLCSGEECQDRFCEECVASFASEAVKRAIYAVPWLHCPGCSSRIPTKSWSSLAPEAYETYRSNAEAMLNFRCPDCHEVGNLLVEASAKGSSLETHRRDAALALKEAWPKFAYATSTPDDLVQNMPNEDIEGILRCIEDLERRTCLHLAWLRMHPFIMTECCDAEFCFKCKVGTHHGGQTCEERQREELDIFCQFCPECEVPTVRTEGCDHIVCVCGADWTWQEVVELGWALGPVRHLRELLQNGTLDPNWKNEGDGSETTLLMSAAGAGMLQNVTALLDAGADVTCRNSSDWSALLFACGVESGLYSADIVDLLLERSAVVSRGDCFTWMASQGSGCGQAVQIFNQLIALSGVQPADVHNGESFLRIAVKHGRNLMAKDLLGRGVPVDSDAAFQFVKSPMRDKGIFDKLLAASGVAIDDADPVAPFKNMKEACLERGLQDLLQHVIVKHGAAASFGEVAKAAGTWWPNETPVMPLAVFDALLMQGRDPWAEEPSAQTVHVAAPTKEQGWLLEFLLRAWEYHLSQPLRRRNSMKQHIEEMWSRMEEKWSSSADIFVKTDKGALALAEAVHFAIWPMARRLILSGAGLDAERQGDPPLLIAVKHCAQHPKDASEIVQLLLNSKADVLKADEKNLIQVAQSSWRDGEALLKQAVHEAREERARKMAKSGDGSINNVGIKLEGQVQCPDCNQKFDFEQAMKIHWRFIHDPSRHQED